MMTFIRRIANYYSDFDLKVLLRLTPSVFEELPLIQQIDQDSLEDTIFEYLTVAEPHLGHTTKSRRSNLFTISDKDLQRSITYIYQQRREVLQPIKRIEQFSLFEYIFS